MTIANEPGGLFIFSTRAFWNVEFIPSVITSIIASTTNVSTKSAKSLRGIFNSLTTASEDRTLPRTFLSRLDLPVFSAPRTPQEALRMPFHVASHPVICKRRIFPLRRRFHRLQSRGTVLELKAGLGTAECQLSHWSPHRRAGGLWFCICAFCLSPITSWLEFTQQTLPQKWSQGEFSQPSTL